MPQTPFRFRPEDAVSLCLLDLANALSHQSEVVLAEAGLTAPQWTVLMNVAGDINFQDGRSVGDGIFSSEIASARGLSRPHISATVTELIRKGLISQQDDPQDRRRKLLRVTSTGLEILYRLQPRRQSINDRMMRDLNGEQRQRLLDLLLAVRRRVRESTCDAEGEGLRIAG